MGKVVLVVSHISLLLQLGHRFLEGRHPVVSAQSRGTFVSSHRAHDCMYELVLARLIRKQAAMGGTERPPQFKAVPGVQVGGPSEPCVWRMLILADPVIWS